MGCARAREEDTHKPKLPPGRVCSCACVCGAALVAELLREDTQSLLRLGSNLSLAFSTGSMKMSPWVRSSVCASNETLGYLMLVVW